MTSQKWSQHYNVDQKGGEIIDRLWNNPNINDVQFVKLVLIVQKHHSTYDPYEPILTTKDGRIRVST